MKYKEEQRILMSGPVEIILRTPLMVEEELKEPIREPTIRPKRKRRRKKQPAISQGMAQQMSGFGARNMSMETT